MIAGNHSAAHTVGEMLDEHRRSTLYNVVQSVLGDVTVNMQLSLQVEEAIQAILSVVRDACVDFAQTWNSRHSQCITRRLPVEVVTDCLHVADVDTRVRASHVSHIWRSIALADHRLWASFSCGEFTERIQQDIAFERLAVMLQRSRPAPFQLKLSHAYHGEKDDYAARVCTLLQSDVRRLQDYDGPCHVFFRLNPNQLVLKELISVNCLTASYSQDAYSATHQLAARCLPNLRRLSGYFLDFRNTYHPYRSLQHLVCSLSHRGEARFLFRFCPSLLTVDLRNVFDNCQLPRGPLPTSILRVTLRAGEWANFAHPLNAWSRESIPHLVLHDATHVWMLIPMFLSAHDGPVALRISDGSPDIILTTEPGGQFRWDIESYDFWNFMNACNAFKQLCAERLTSLSLSIAHIWSFLEVWIHARLLVSLEIHLAGDPEMLRLSEQTSTFHLRTPRLRHFVLNLPGSVADVCAHLDDLTVTLKILNRDFRALFVYDADLLDSITLRGSAVNFAVIKCPDFARYAKKYIIDDEGDAL